MEETMKLTDGMRDTLERVARFGFASDGLLFWNGPRRNYASRLVKRGFLERTEYPKSAGYILTDKGRAALT